MKTTLLPPINISPQRKAWIRTLILFLLLSSGALTVSQKASAQVQVDVSFQVFYDNLSPYGNWVDNPDFGYVWIPDVSPDFTPYGSSGHWIYTYEGWTWVSDYSWGWAPFHYGRWFNDPYYGWAWIPDNEWGPGWVTWRRSNDYYGWAPIGPGISIDFAYGSNYNLPYNSWRFVRNRDFGRTNIYNYYVNSSEVTTIINNSTVISNIKEDNSRHVRYNTGPDRNEAERRVGKTFDPITIKENNRPGHNLRRHQLEIYRPEVKKMTFGQKPAPTKVVDLKEVKPKRERNFDHQQNQEQLPTEQPHGQQKKERPVRQQPNYEQPQKEQPVMQQPNYQQPKQQRPTKQQRIQQRKEQPVKQHPRKKGGA